MALPKLHTLVYRQQVFTYEEARRKLKLSASSLYKMLHELQRDGYILRIKKRVYAVVPVEAAGRTYRSNKHLVAARLQKKSYLSYHTALELHGVAESAYNTAYISVPWQARSFQFQGTTYSFVTEYDSFGLTKIKVEGIPLVVSDVDLLEEIYSPTCDVYPVRHALSFSGFSPHGGATYAIRQALDNAKSSVSVQTPPPSEPEVCWGKIDIN